MRALRAARTSMEPLLITPGRIANAIGVPLHRVLRILSTRPHIRPAARAGTIRLYDRATIAKVRSELNLVDARRCRRQEVNLGE